MGFDPISFLFAVAIMIASYVIAPKTSNNSNKPERASLSDFDFPQAEEGTPQIVVFGDCWIKDWTVLWYGNLRSEAIKTKGGKK